ncbi:nitrogen fixation negative regulator NifL [Candidatus Competibacter phosphatis]|uniref:histidine kinase n=1 Tax=Candidatus Competibacter phosphatis TaxID=221280 RepID=A0ABX1TI37_9GAMM|nr:nitrogen fixation negative regulator NifL [Candidatus Competibacter phosphatis]
MAADQARQTLDRAAGQPPQAVHRLSGGTDRHPDPGSPGGNRLLPRHSSRRDRHAPFGTTGALSKGVDRIDGGCRPGGHRPPGRERPGHPRQPRIQETGRRPAGTGTGGRIPACLRETLGETFPWGANAEHGFRDREVSFDPGGKGQPRWFSCSGVWFREQDSSAATFFKPVRQTYLLLMANEITALKRQQEAVGMNAMRALLAEQERVRSMREALQAAIFQMQGPMNLISAARDLLERRGAQADPALRHALNQAAATGQTALERLRALVPAVPPEAATPVNINQLLREVLELCKQRLLAGGTVVDWKPAPMLPAVTARASRLRGMFKQLIDNALDAMDSNRHQPRELRITTATQEQTVSVVIEDTGPGVASDLQWRIFEPFFTTKRAATHVGLGLAMVQEVVNEQRGMITLDPDYDAGCRWQVLLPIKYEDDS